MFPTENCPRCGAKSWTVVEKRGAMETFLCSKCTNTMSVHASYTADDLGLSRPKAFRVFASPGCKMSNADAAHRIAGLTGQLGSASDLRTIAGGARVYIGLYAQSEIAELRARADELCIQLSVEADPDDKGGDDGG